ncbi:MAG TPA: NADH-quinone oxidoreductase subunit J [Bdellovibrionota bacterium]|nr:NADH-quinone oxidoreductase subunit J [Bdellovibrionota bacterium]
MDWMAYTFSGIAIISALLVVTRKNPLYSALYLIVTLFSIAGLFVIVEAYFIAVLQVLVYAGAVMVLFVFVIMLLNLDPTHLNIPGIQAPRLFAVLSAIGIFGVLAWMFLNNRITGVVGEETPEKIAALGGNLQAMSLKLFTHYLLPFEVTSILLLVAIVGAVVLAKRKV